MSETMSVTLPNGTVIEGIPTGTSKEDIKAKAIAKGLATEQDFSGAPAEEESGYSVDDFKQAGLNVISDLGAMGGGLYGAAQGAVIGSTIPVVGTAIGALVGGAIGAFGGTIGGDVIEQYLKDNIDDYKAVETLKEAAVNGGLELAGGTAMEAVVGVGRLATKGYSVLRGQNQKTVTNMVSDLVGGADELPEELATLRNKLQEELSERGGSLTPTQVNQKSELLQAIEDVGYSSLGAKQKFDTVYKIQQDYIHDEITKLVAMEGKLAPEQAGVLIQNTIDNARKANSQLFQTEFEKLADLGEDYAVNLLGLKNLAKAEKAKYIKPLTQSAKQAIKDNPNADIPFMPSEVKKVLSDIDKLSPNSDFTASNNVLKNLRKLIDDKMVTDGGKNSPVVVDLLRLKDAFEESIIKSAKKNTPEGAVDITATYKDINARYKQSMEDFYNDAINAIMNKNSPELIGYMLANKGGEITTYKKLMEAVKKGAAQSDNISASDIQGIENSIKVTFLEEFLSRNPEAAVSSVSKMDEKLFDSNRVFTVYDEMFTSAEKGRIRELMDKVRILKGRDESSAAFSFAVKSRQIGAVDPSGDKSIRNRLLAYLVPQSMAKAALDPKMTNALLKSFKVLELYPNEAKIPASVKVSLMGLLAKASINFEEGLNKRATIETDKQAQQELNELRKILAQ